MLIVRLACTENSNLALALRLPSAGKVSQLTCVQIGPCRGDAQGLSSIPRLDAQEVLQVAGGGVSLPANIARRISEATLHDGRGFLSEPSEQSAMELP